MPEISVIVTAYDIAAYIDECLDDILAQDFEDLEVIVVDDGSRDGTPERIRAAAERDARIVPLLLETNSVGGVATAANAGIARATGRYIGFADGDDRYDPTMFGKLHAAASASNADLAICSYLNMDTETGETAEPPDAARWREIAPEGVLVLDEANRRRALSLNAVPWRKLYDAELVRKHGLRFPVGDFFYEDNPFHWFALLSADRLAFVDERLCLHRVNRIGQTTANVDAKLLRMFQHHAIIKRWLEEHGHDSAFRLDLLSWAARQLSWIGRKCPEELREDLFTAIREVVALHDAEDLASPELRARIGKRTSGLLLAARDGDFDAFCAGLDKSAGRAPKKRSASDGFGARLRGLLGR
ncbi:glycosyltransferase [Tropicimonas sp. TH_r6]|uniref:glycosyltransferase family 2 protein n=1 Tax=Tropicimonas sp. TH_r6 TaxID=3082085 RepID=UPI002953363C|nr:glycosyltransferase [Tropicimonas sp. TH_r6]MDV7141153.1 glycosyltransferase [Tropicimonas sp. TH_r6]